jgi:hypothetical protein
MGIPGAAGFRMNVGETCSRRRVGDANEMLAGRTLNLSSGVTRVALQRLVTVGTIEFEFGCAHRIRFHDHYAQTGPKKYIKYLFILLVRGMRM